MYIYGRYTIEMITDDTVKRIKASFFAADGKKIFGKQCRRWDPRSIQSVWWRKLLATIEKNK